MYFSLLNKHNGRSNIKTLSEGFYICASIEVKKHRPRCGRCKGRESCSVFNNSVYEKNVKGVIKLINY